MFLSLPSHHLQISSRRFLQQIWLYKLSFLLYMDFVAVIIKLELMVLILKMFFVELFSYEYVALNVFDVSKNTLPIMYNILEF